MREDLVKMLQSYPATDAEKVHVARTLDLLHDRRDCFYRTCFAPGHITGSSLLVSTDDQRVLMNHHGSLDKWICFGGHADGDEDIEAVARRELEEESGIMAFDLAAPGLFDVDVHAIPANPKKGEPAHEHFDIRFLYRATGNEAFALSHELHELRWCGFDEAMALAGDDSMRRLLGKWRALQS